MRDILLFFVVGLYAFWGYSVIKKVDAYSWSEEDESESEVTQKTEIMNEQEKMTIIGVLQHRLLSWYRHPRLSRFLFRILMHL